ncbi:NB-ARC domain-containing protein [[Kitasatospora] papulosa]|uniref:NB-ARC domain-containing protein n=1 Tax=Streptomyces TaxID=1883 RepID=UPI0006743284
MRDQIDQARVSHDTVVLSQVLAGGGGVGKTQLAAVYAHQSLAAGVELVVWVDASETEQVIARYAQAAYWVQAAEGPAGKAEQDARAFLQWLATTSRSWLLVLDDVTDLEGLQPWWPPPSSGGGGRVLATTRRHDALLSGGGRAVVNIDTYNAEEADTYLSERLRVANAVHLLDAQAGKVAEALGYLPLALAHAAAYMVNEDVPCTDYLHRFNDSTVRMSALLPRQADTEGYGRRVAAALMLSLDIAQQCEPVGLAIPALRLASVLDPAGHPRSFWTSEAATRYLSAHRLGPISAARSSDDVQAEGRSVIRLLHRYGLLIDDAQAGPRAVRVHALTARAVREHTPSDALPDIVKTAADALAELWWTVPPIYREERAVLRTNIDSLDGHAGDLLWEVEGHHLLRWAGRSLTGYGLATAAVHYWQQLTATSERLLGRTHPHTLAVRRDLAVAYFRADNPKQGFAMLQEDFHHQEHVLSLARPTAGEAGTTSQLEGTGTAIELLEDTLAARERLLGPEDPAALNARVQLALAYRHAGMTKNATLTLSALTTDTPQRTRQPGQRAPAHRLQRWWERKR